MRLVMLDTAQRLDAIFGPIFDDIYKRKQGTS
jgi:hypothetical protein